MTQADFGSELKNIILDFGKKLPVETPLSEMEFPRGLVIVSLC